MGLFHFVCEAFNFPQGIILKINFSLLTPAMITLIDHKTPLDLVSISTVAATIIGTLPHIAALLSIIWTVIRIYETPTFQKWMKKRHKK